MTIGAALLIISAAVYWQVLLPQGAVFFHKALKGLNGARHIQTPHAPVGCQTQVILAHALCQQPQRRKLLLEPSEDLPEALISSITILLCTGVSTNSS